MPYGYGGAGGGVTLEEVNTIVEEAVDGLIAGAPPTLDTLEELAAAFGDDANFAATMTTALAGKESTQTAASQAEAEAGTEAEIRKWSPLRIAQAIAALGGGGANHNYTQQPVTATGSNQGNAAALTASKLNLVSGADGIKGVKLPSAAAGLWLVVVNLTNAFNQLLVWPSSGDEVRAFGANPGLDSSINVDNHSARLFLALDNTTWTGL